MTVDPLTATWDALGTSASIVVTDPRALAPARAAVEAQLAQIDEACSRFRDDSELTALNARAGRTTRIGPLLLNAIEVALRAAVLTDGIVDPTIGRALIVAGYDGDFAQLRPGTAPRIPVARATAGWQAVAIDRPRGTVRVPHGVLLDLGATAKALAADRAAAAATTAARSGVLVNLGGDLILAGPPPPGGWLVRVADDHRAAADAPSQTIAIAGGGLATSSTTVRHWAPDGHHIIDPRTGRPARSCWRTVSVAARTCVDANIASTAAIVLARRAPHWLSARGLPARLVTTGGGTTTVGGWPAEREATAA